MKVGSKSTNLTVRTERNAVAYMRMSKDEQTLSIDAQRAEIVKWAKLYKVTIVKWFIDEGVSGKTDPTDREGLRALLDHVSSRSIDYVVIAVRDRFSRDTKIDGFCEYYIEKQGAAVFSCSEDPEEPPTPERSLLRNMLKSIAQFERELTGWRTRKALEVLRSRGATLGRPPQYEAAQLAVFHYVVEFLRKYGLNSQQIYQYLCEQGYPRLSKGHVDFYFYRRTKQSLYKRRAKHSFAAIRHWLRPYFRQYIWTPPSQTPLASSSPETGKAATQPIASQSLTASSSTSASSHIVVRNRRLSARPLLTST